MAKRKKDPRVADPAKFSKSTLAANPDLLKALVEQRGTSLGRFLSPQPPQSTAKPIPKGPQPNKTELRFRDLWHRITGHNPEEDLLHFQPITLRIGRRRYTPDWVHYEPSGILLIEVKGPYIYEDAKLKYDLFKTHFEKISNFRFEMWQEEDRVWKKIR